MRRPRVSLRLAVAATAPSRHMRSAIPHRYLQPALRRYIAVSEERAAICIRVDATSCALHLRQSAHPERGGCGGIPPRCSPIDCRPRPAAACTTATTSSKAPQPYTGLISPNLLGAALVGFCRRSDRSARLASSTPPPCAKGLTPRGIAPPKEERDDLSAPLSRHSRTLRNDARPAVSGARPSASRPRRFSRRSRHSASTRAQAGSGGLRDHA
jgi:hypothetical protein